MNAASSSGRLAWYTKPNCGLCDDAWPHVRRASRILRLPVDVVDISGNRKLVAAFGTRLPVLANGERVLAEGVISGYQAWRAMVRVRLNPGK